MAQHTFIAFNEPACNHLPRSRRRKHSSNPVGSVAVRLMRVPTVRLLARCEALARVRTRFLRTSACSPQISGVLYTA